ncbi:unnamed protein product, partial [Discosporangium mesarthrocarpum]
VSSPHLARSYHHLFPVPQFEETLPPRPQGSEAPSSCAGCLKDLTSQASYRCPDCSCVFCLNCDMYIHDSLHNCPGCC